MSPSPRTRSWNRPATVLSGVLAVLAVAVAPSIAGTGFVDGAILLDVFLVVTIAAVVGIAARSVVALVGTIRSLLRGTVGDHPAATARGCDSHRPSPTRLTRGSTWARAPAALVPIA